MLRGNRNLLRRTDIKTRLTLAFIFVPLCLLIVVFFIYYSFSTNMIKDKNEQTSAQVVAMSEEIFHLNADKLNKQIDNLAASTYVRNYLYYPKDAAIRRAFSHNLHANDLLVERKGLQLYDAAGKLLYEEGTLFSADLKAYKKEIQAQKQGGFWLYDPDTHLIMLTREIRNLYDQPLGYVFCSFEKDFFNESLAQFTQPGNIMLVADAKGQVLFGSNSERIHEAVDVKASAITVNQQSYYVTSKKIEGTPWYAVYLCDEDYVLEEIHNFRNMLLLYGIVFFVLLALIAYFVYHSIYDPVHNILHSMRTLDENNLAMNRVLDDGRDEIHELSMNFNDLLDRVQELLYTVHQEQEQKRETQFQLLQAQINPHFLFNALNTISYYCSVQPQTAKKLINYLADYYRQNLADPNTLISLRQELQHINAYINIEIARFGDKLKINYEIDDTAFFKVPALILQPIIENSVKHGLRSKLDGGTITITVSQDTEYFFISVHDDGIGIPEVKLASLLLDIPGRKSIGLTNIHKRLMAIYGPDNGLHIDSTYGTGTTVSFKIPKQEED